MRLEEAFLLPMFDSFLENIINCETGETFGRAFDDFSDLLCHSLVFLSLSASLLSSPASLLSFCRPFYSSGPIVHGDVVR